MKDSAKLAAKRKSTGRMGGESDYGVRMFNPDQPTRSANSAAASRFASRRNTVLFSLLIRAIVPVWLGAQPHQNEGECPQIRRAHLLRCQAYLEGPSLPLRLPRCVRLVCPWRQPPSGT